MTRKTLKAVNICALVVLIAILAYTAFLFTSFYRSGSSNAKIAISRISERAYTLLSLESQNRGTQGVVSEQSSQLNTLRKSLTELSQLKSFVLYNSNGEIIYIYARNPSYVRVLQPQSTDQYLRASIDLPYNNLFETTQKVSIDKNSNMYGEGVYQVFTPHRLFSVSKILFFALGALFLVLLFSIVGAHKERSAVASEVVSSESDTFTNEISSDTESTEEEGHDVFSEDALYTPDTGLCFEQYLEERLSNELRRAAAFDQDLVAALIKCRNGLEERALYIQLAHIVKDHFTFHDLLFEVEHDKIAVILPNTDLEQGINELSDFQRELFNGASDNFCSFDISIGISSRNGRLINSPRILKEARVALNKAEKDSETNLIGFRPDPGKFRSFLANSG